MALFQALPRLGSRLSLLLIQCLTAPFGALIEWLWLGTGLTGRQILCGITILAGVGVALTPGEHLKIPLTLKSSRSLDITGAQHYRAEVRFLKNLLYPTGATPLGVEEGKDRIVTIRSSSRPMNTCAPCRPVSE